MKIKKLYILYQHNKITKNVFNNLIKSIIIMEENMIAIRDPKTYCFTFDWPKDTTDESLNHEMELLIKDINL